jgi:glycosyltransferase involved in cell wall biosynthesis
LLRKSAALRRRRPPPQRERRACLISPQPWEHLPISKHHYARALAARGWKVFFLEPPAAGEQELRLQATGVKGLTRIRYPEPWWARLRFHARPVYDWLEGGLVRRIRARIGGPLDLVWSFDFNRFADLRKFRAGRAIFHPVDPLSQPSHRRAATSADLVLSVSGRILASCRPGRTPHAVIPHGLSGPFARLAQKSNPWKRRRGPLRVGYAGNLTRPILDRPTLWALIRAHLGAEFHFWGQREGGDPEAREFCRELERQPNVRLHGAVPPEELAKRLAAMDCLLLAYRSHATESDLSNAHKILEYFSTGRAVLSCILEEHQTHPAGVARFVPAGKAKAYMAALAEILRRPDRFNSPKLARQRKTIALRCTYARNLDRILCLAGFDESDEVPLTGKTQLR